MSQPDILSRLAEAARQRVAEAKQQVSLAEIRAQALAKGKGDFAFEKALARPGLSLICECKQASPSKGQIATDGYDPVQIAKEYEQAGASCISVLTEPYWFKGSNQDLEAVAGAVSLPVLRKDFTVDPYMIYEARVLGAQCVLLISGLLSEKELKDYLGIADELGISALVEAHTSEQLEQAIRAGARVLGVNNRNLKDFTVDFDNALRLREQVPEDILFVCESGIKNRADIQAARAMKADAALIGETLMKAADKKACVQELLDES